MDSLGGLVVLWNADLINVTEMRISEQEIHCLIQVSPTKPFWLLSAIYASRHYQLRDMLWNSLINLHINNDLSWLIGGDFNEILESRDKFGGLPINNNRADKFANFMHSCNLLDLGFQGSRFTWTNKQRNGHTILERLDHFWLIMISKVYFQTLL